MKPLAANIKSFLGYLTGGFILFTLACTNGRLEGEWAVPVNQIFEGQGNGDIPAINNPQFTKASQTTFLTDESIIIGIQVGEIIKAYPLDIMDWHEVVNDEIDSLAIAITHSSLSGSSIGLTRNINGQLSEFSVTGLLFNSNTIFNDQETQTDWSQMLRKGIRGGMTETPLNSFNVLEMNWAKWRQLFPDSDVLNQNTSFNRPYGDYPYGDYQMDATKIFFDLPLDIDSLNNVFPLKEKMLGVIVADIAKGYRFESFEADVFSIIEDEINGEPIIVIGNPTANFLVAYNAKDETGQRRNLDILDNGVEVLIIDELGNEWSLFGQGLENNQLPLENLESNIAYWFSWATFYPQIEIFQG